QPAVADPALEYFFNNADSVGGDITREEFYAGLVSAGGVAKADILMDYYEDLWGDDGYLGDDYESFNKKFRAVFSDKEANYQTTDSGQYCYCQMDGFMPNGGTKEIVTSAPWVFGDPHGSADSCVSNCAYSCAFGLRAAGVSFLAFRAAVVGALEAVETGGICTANTINIDWNPDNNGAHIKNMCTYDGSITVPADPVKPGYTFTGWKLIESTTTE
ncbi:MAG: InlB B-repeat-containing protein, partial [Alphaproteobacteria bacterium]|nr:InlB B-repeat-containing protein [Alphaproteobacteria bacterium]